MVPWLCSVIDVDAGLECAHCGLWDAWSPRMQASKERVPLSLGFVGLWLLHYRGDTVHSLLDEVLREPCPASVPPRAATMDRPVNQ